MLAERVSKARRIVEFGLTKIMDRDKEGKARLVLVPGSEGKQYEVILRRPTKHSITTECRLVVGTQGHQNCPGNSNGYVCYHSLQAIITSAKDCDSEVMFTESADSARKLRNLGYSLFTLRSWQSARSRTVFMAVKSSKPIKTSAKQDMIDLFGEE